MSHLWLKDLHENSPADILRKKTIAILNKLTQQKFESLKRQFDELVIDTWGKLEMCIHLVFEKALDEPEFSAVYAEMCNKLKSKCPQGSDAQKNAFKSILITLCERKFCNYNYMQDLDKSNYNAAVAMAESEERKKEIENEWAKKETYARKRRLGTIRFIGELYKHKMLTVRIIHECINELLNIEDFDTLQAQDESLKCLCILMTTVGKHFEDETTMFLKKSLKQNKKNSVISQPDIYFKKMKRLADNYEDSASRIRFMLLDVIDLRRCNWKPIRLLDSQKKIECSSKTCISEDQKNKNQDVKKSKNVKTPISSLDSQLKKERIDFEETITKDLIANTSKESRKRRATSRSNVAIDKQEEANIAKAIKLSLQEKQEEDNIAKAIKLSLQDQKSSSSQQPTRSSSYFNTKSSSNQSQSNLYPYTNTHMDLGSYFTSTATSTVCHSATSGSSYIHEERKKEGPMQQLNDQYVRNSNNGGIEGLSEREVWGSYFALDCKATNTKNGNAGKVRGRQNDTNGSIKNQSSTNVRKVMGKKEKLDPSDVLECPICYEMPLKPIYQCQNGHLICHVCHSKVKKCPICVVNIDHAKPCRCLVAEYLMDGMINVAI